MVLDPKRRGLWACPADQGADGAGKDGPSRMGWGPLMPDRLSGSGWGADQSN